jgi:hypothetical protein
MGEVDRAGGLRRDRQALHPAGDRAVARPVDREAGLLAGQLDAERIAADSPVGTAPDAPDRRLPREERVELQADPVPAIEPQAAPADGQKHEQRERQVEAPPARPRGFHHGAPLASRSAHGLH